MERDRFLQRSARISLGLIAIWALLESHIIKESGCESEVRYLYDNQLAVCRSSNNEVLILWRDREILLDEDSLNIYSVHEAENLPEVFWSKLNLASVEVHRVNLETGTEVEVLTIKAPL